MLYLCFDMLFEVFHKCILNTAQESTSYFIFKIHLL
jgi:hypothetical protein